MSSKNNQRMEPLMSSIWVESRSWHTDSSREGNTYQNQIIFFSSEKQLCKHRLLQDLLFRTNKDSKEKQKGGVLGSIEFTRSIASMHYRDPHV